MNPIMNPAHPASPFNMMNPANPVSPLNPLNPIHNSSHHHSTDTIATTAVPDSIVEVNQTDNGPIAGYIMIGVILGFVLGFIVREAI